jgi:hypothetical protein
MGRNCVSKLKFNAFSKVKINFSGRETPSEQKLQENPRIDSAFIFINFLCPQSGHLNSIFLFDPGVNLFVSEISIKYFIRSGLFVARQLKGVIVMLILIFLTGLFPLIL